jgi:AraC-like DNA-binding protein
MSLFKKLFGRSIFEFISDKRMELAMNLLRERNLSVMEISRTLGYKNPNHFSAAFKKKFNMTPSSVV